MTGTLPLSTSPSISRPSKNRAELANFGPSLALMLWVASATAWPAGAQTPGDVGLGKRLYQEKATCGFCHGWSGDGAGDPQSPPVRRRICARPSLTTISWSKSSDVACRAEPQCRILTICLDQGRGVLR